jgi:Entner-Doudoroff aldolase
MSPDEFVSLFGELRASAILRTDIAGAVRPAMAAAVAAGFRIVEFTMTTPGALDCIAEFAQRPDLVVGAGTVLTEDDARAAVDHGARFLVSPVIDKHVVETAVSLGVAMMPGTHTPTEMLQAHLAGAPLQKLFPAPGLGPEYVRACLGPLPFLNIVPTSGVDASNAAAYLDAGAHAVGFVSPLFDAGRMRQGDFGWIEQRARVLLEAVRGARKGNEA